MRERSIHSEDTNRGPRKPHGHAALAPSSRSASRRSRCIFDRRWAAAARAHPAMPKWPARPCCKTQLAARCKTPCWHRLMFRIGEELVALLHGAADPPGDALQQRCPPDAEIAALCRAQHRFLPARARCEMGCDFLTTFLATAFACLLGPCLRSCLRKLILHPIRFCEARAAPT